MAILTYKKDSNEQLSPHFTVAEFRCGCAQCDTVLIDSELVEKLEALRGSLAQPLIVDSGYRCAAYQAELRARGYETSVGPSQHELGRATDIRSGALTGSELEKAARAIGFMAVGVAPTWIHCDLRNDKTRAWQYSR